VTLQFDDFQRQRPRYHAAGGRIVWIANTIAKMRWFAIRTIRPPARPAAKRPALPLTEEPLIFGLV